jgi:hypothetical protein
MLTSGLLLDAEVKKFKQGFDATFNRSKSPLLDALRLG